MLVSRYLVSATGSRTQSYKILNLKLNINLKLNLQVPITVVGAFLMDKSGRRPLIMVITTANSIHKV